MRTCEVCFGLKQGAQQRAGQDSLWGVLGHTAWGGLWWGIQATSGKGKAAGSLEEGEEP